MMQVIPALQAREIPAAGVLVERCVCCWSAVHPDQQYPASWSSTLCPFHAAWTLQRRRRTREQGGRHA
jgi:hypothetical protein